jgi:hypothetical protein
MVNSINTAAATLNSDVQASVTGLNLKTAGASFSGSIVCGQQTCTWSAARASEAEGGASANVVVNGGGTRSNANENTAVDNNGNPVANELVYRMNLTMPSGVVLPLDVTIQGLDTSPIATQVLTLRLDRAAITTASAEYEDQLCGLTTISCSVVTAGADTTVVQSQWNCFQQTNGVIGVASGCNPIGDSSPSPQPQNNYATTTNNDGSIGGAIVP